MTILFCYNNNSELYLYNGRRGNMTVHIHTLAGLSLVTLVYLVKLSILVSLATSLLNQKPTLVPMSSRLC